MANDVTIVFLHGAGMGPWVWDRVIQELSTPAVALEIPGRSHSATPDNCAAAIAAELDRLGIGPVIVVMHSLAGVLATGLAERLGPRAKRFVFVSAVIPPSGGSFVDALGFMNRQILRVLFKFNPNGLKPSPKMIQHELCNDLEPPDTEEVISRYEPEMPGLYLTPVTATAPIVNATYVKLLKDQSVPPALQDSMIARLDKPLVREIEAGHLVMLSTPMALANLIQEEAEKPA